MKKFYFSFASLIAMLLSLSIPVKADTESIVISFLKKQVTSGQSNISGQYIYDELLTDASKEWIESIECVGVKTRKEDTSGKNTGILLYPTNSTGKEAYIVLNLKSDKLIRADKITVYIAPWGPSGYAWQSSKDINLELICNGTKVSDMPNLPNPGINNLKPKGTEDIKTLSDYINNDNASNIAWTSPTLTDSAPLKAIEIKAIKPASSNYNFEEAEVYAVKIEYDKDFKVAVNEIEQDNVSATPEFFDLMGRRLYTAPANGIYIMKTGSKIQKVLAR